MGTDKSASPAKAANVKCDGCSKSFVIELKERPLACGGAQQRFQCPHCKKYYVVANITPAGVKIRQQVRQVEETLKAKPGDDGLVAELARLKAELAKEVTKN